MTRTRGLRSLKRLPCRNSAGSIEVAALPQTEMPVPLAETEPGQIGPEVHGDRTARAG